MAAAHLAFSVEKTSLSHLCHIYFMSVTLVCTAMVLIPDYTGTSLQGNKAFQCWRQSPATKEAANSTKNMSCYAALSAQFSCKNQVPQGPAIISLFTLPWRGDDSDKAPGEGICESTAAYPTALPARGAGRLWWNCLSQQPLHSHALLLLLSPLPWRKVCILDRSPFLLSALSGTLQPILKDSASLAAAHK